MGNFVFYKDSHKTFECDVTIEGASTNSTEVRMVLEFGDRSLLFNGEIRDGHVTVWVPKLSEVTEDYGNATLEIIADQTYFKAWQSPVELKRKRSVTVSEVRGSDDSAKVVVRNVSEDKPSKSVVSETRGVYKDSCSPTNKKFVMESFNKFKTMDGQNKKQIKHKLKDFEAKPTIKEWAKSVFNDIDTPYAKYCMYELQKGKK